MLRRARAGIGVARVRIPLKLGGFNFGKGGTAVRIVCRVTGAQVCRSTYLVTYCGTRQMMNMHSPLTDA